MNFDADNFVIVAFPRYAGGKFLINCLGLSDDAVLQDKSLAEKQLNGNFSHDDKINYILIKLSNEADYKNQKNWMDLDLGCDLLLGHYETWYEKKEPIQYFDIVNTLSNRSEKFFIVAHKSYNVANIIKIWKNAKIIFFTNTLHFRHLRIGMDNHSVLDPKWETKCKQLIKEENFNNLYYFDTNNYFSEEKTVNGVKELYQQLNLKGFNETSISLYYKEWIKKCLPLELVKLKNS
jgi:hypothetical protein